LAGSWTYVGSSAESGVSRIKVGTLQTTPAMIWIRSWHHANTLCTESFNRFRPGAEQTQARSTSTEASARPQRVYSPAQPHTVYSPAQPHTVYSPPQSHVKNAAGHNTPGPVHSDDAGDIIGILVLLVAGFAVTRVWVAVKGHCNERQQRKQKEAARWKPLDWHWA